MEKLSQSIAVIVDSNQESCDLLKSVINQNFELQAIYTFTSAQKASTEIPKLSKVDLLFFDSDLSDINCFDFINDLKQENSLQSCKYTLLSQNNNQELLLQAASVGVHEFLLKPFTENAVVAKMRKLALGKQQRQSERISLFEAINANLQFGNHEYHGAIVDLSEGGCLVKTTLFNKGGGFIYDICNITIATDEQINLDAELIRLERDATSENSSIFAAFIFQNVGSDMSQKLTKFLAKVTQPTPA